MAPMPELNLTPFEVRVLGSLAEKAFLTPDIYPLSLNAIVTACNQVSNREPVMELSEETVQRALDSLKDKKLVRMWWPHGSRVSKYDHVMHEVYGLNEAQLAALTVLMLRGPQTPGEIKGRTGRMHIFHEVERVEGTLKTLMEDRATLLAMQLPRAPGTKEARYAHLLSGQLAVERQEMAEGMSGNTVSATVIEGRGDDRIAALEDEVQQLRAEVNWLSRQLSEFKKQFE
jgi:uncharacterized protein